MTMEVSSIDQKNDAASVVSESSNNNSRSSKVMSTGPDVILVGSVSESSSSRSSIGLMSPVRENKKKKTLNNIKLGGTASQQSSNSSFSLHLSPEKTPATKKKSSLKSSGKMKYQGEVVTSTNHSSEEGSLGSFFVGSPIKASSKQSLHRSYTSPVIRSPSKALLHKDLHQSMSPKLVVGGQASFSSLALCVNDSQAPNTAFEDCYDLQSDELLGEGGFAMVYRCQHKVNNAYYAVKDIQHDDYQDGPANSLKEEITSMKTLRECPYIVRLHDVFYEHNRTYLVMEEMKGGDLLDKICEKITYNEDDAKKVTTSLLDAVRYCHKKNIAHRDIKPENILIADKTNDTNIKLCDFGCARTVTSTNCFKTMAGSAQYAAPEVYDYGMKGGYNEQCDLWSVGVVVYVLLGGYCPFEDRNGMADLTHQICNADYEFHEKFWKDISEKPKDLIRALLVIDADKRLNADKALDSKWLRRTYYKIPRSSSGGALASLLSPSLTKKKKASYNKLDPKLHQSMTNLNMSGHDDDDDSSYGFGYDSPPSATKKKKAATRIPAIEWRRSLPVINAVNQEDFSEASAEPTIKPFEVSSPMKWLPQSPEVSRMQRELLVTNRRRKAKMTLGESLRSLHSLQVLEDDDDNEGSSLDFNNSRGSGSEGTPNNNLNKSKPSLDFHESLACIVGLPSIPQFGGDDEEHSDHSDHSLNPDDLLKRR